MFSCKSKTIRNGKHPWHLLLEIIPLCTFMFFGQNGSSCTHFSQLHWTMHTRTTYSQRKNIPQLKATADGNARSVIMYYIRHGNISTKKDTTRQCHARLKEKVATCSSPLLKSTIHLSKHNDKSMAPFFWYQGDTFDYITYKNVLPTSLLWWQGKNAQSRCLISRPTCMA